jgi:RimJ/RimL family protein N-acetyltransferase
MPPATNRPIVFAAANAGTARPPAEIRAGPLLLRRMRPGDAIPIAATVAASLAHLRPWMPWATPEAADPRGQLLRIAEADEMWDAGTDYIYLILVARDMTLAGTIGLHRRIGDGGIEIGYWIAASQTRRGYATEAARALTSAALGLAGVRRVEIHCDEVNIASAGVPRKLGYRLDRIDPHEPEAPGESGRRMIWVCEPLDHPAGGRQA